MKTSKALTLIAAASLAVLLSACGGGGGGSDSTGAGGSSGNGSGDNSGGSTGGSTNTTIPSGTTQATPTYTAGSAEAQVLTSINAYRTQCGFPAMSQNTILDKASANHAAYMLSNGGIVTDSEVSGNTGFTGVTGLDRAVAQGWPSGVYAGASDAGYYTNATLSAAEYGQKLVDAWSAGVYHQVTIAFPSSLIGVGSAQQAYNGFPQVVGGVTLGQVANVTTAANSPLTFPCQGVTGIPYGASDETPKAPSTSGAWGTPVTVVGNPGDVVNLNTASYTPQGGLPLANVIILTSANDATGLLGKYQAVAYPLSALQPNTVYSVSLTGTVNGVAFSRNFTFTTGATIG